MATFTLSFLSLVILFLTCSAKDNYFIENSCKVTRYPPNCVKSLTPKAKAIGQSPVKLAEIALSTSLTKAQSLNKFLLEEIRKPGLGSGELSALKDCLDGMDDSIEYLKKSIRETTTMEKSPDEFMMLKSNVQTWVSSVLTDFNTCAEGFRETSEPTKFTEDVKPKMVEVQQGTSNALALVNQLTGPA